MADAEDTTNDQDTTADDTDGGEEGESTTDDEADTSTDENTDAEDSEDDSEDDSDDSKGKGDSKETDTTDEEEAEDDDDAEPESRRPKTNKEWAAKRIADKAKKDGADSEKKGDTADETADDEEDDGLSDEDREAFDKRIEKHLAPFQQREAEQEVDAEIATFLQANPDFKPFAVKARRFAMHESRKNIPVKSIFYEVAGDKLMAIGAKRAKVADAKAKAGKTGGNTNSADQQGNKSYKDMSLEDFGKEVEAEKLKPRK